MRSYPLPFILLLTAGWLLGAWSWAQPVQLQNRLTFYGDEEGFDGPYRAEQTLFGQQFQSAFEVPAGDRTILEAGAFFDHPSAVDSTVNVLPILSFKYFTPTTRLVFGTLETKERHGFLEPLEVETLEITRAVEYGLQWEEADGWLVSDWFLNWQQVNTPGNPEIFDYGGVSRFTLAKAVDAEFQFHGYHQGGKLFYVGVVNNYVPALGLRFHGPLGPLGDGSLSAFGLLSGNLQGPFLQVTQSQWGEGLYLRGSVSPWNLAQLYGILWFGQDFFSWEGDGNYNSGGLDGFYQSNRTYGEIGLRKTLAGGTDADLEAELRTSCVDGQWDYSGRLLTKASFGVEVPVQRKVSSEQ
ncbi:MAG TPA: hypothetical protein VGR89_08260 [Puia sp.]|nr:hypothetical protein [Puia sp.]